jgi:ribose transport system substrate-binding protein
MLRMYSIAAVNKQYADASSWQLDALVFVFRSGSGKIHSGLQMWNVVRNFLSSHISSDRLSSLARSVDFMHQRFSPTSVFRVRQGSIKKSWDDAAIPNHQFRCRPWGRPIALWQSFGLILCTGMFGCGPRVPHTIAVIPATTGPELWEAAHGGAETAGRETGFHIYWNGPTREDDVARQITLVERAIDDEDAGLVVAPTNYLALVGSVRQALSKHIPTVVIRSSLPIPPGQGLSYILNDDQETGRLAAARIGVLLGGKGKVAVLGLDATGPRSILRVRAFEAELAKGFPEISVVEKRSGSSNTAEVQQTAQEILVDNPSLNAILTLDVNATEGTWAALVALGKGKKVKLIGCGQEVDLMAAIRHGDIDSVIAENTYEMGFRAIQGIAAQRRGESVPGRIELKPVLVTRENIDTAEIQKILSVNWRGSQ